MGEKTMFIVGELSILKQVISSIIRHRVLSVLASEGCSVPPAIPFSFLNL